MKQPANNPEAEQSLLATIMLDKNAIDYCSDLVSEDFYQSRHQSLFSAIMRLKSQGKAVDLVTVAEVLKKEGTLEEVGGAIYFAKICDISASPV